MNFGGRTLGSVSVVGHAGLPAARSKRDRPRPLAAMAAAGRFREVPAKILKEIIVISHVPGPGGSLLDILLGGLGGLFGAGDDARQLRAAES